MTAIAVLDRLDQVKSVIARLFDPEVGIGVTDPRLPQPALMPGEGDHLARAVAKRHADFAAGRAAARLAMQAIGFQPRPILTHTDRSPIWPNGITGSITHKDTLCAAVITGQDVHLGLDIEEDTPLKAGLLPSICSDDEIARIAGPDQNFLAKLIFSAKESAYKAQYPLTRQLFGFGHMDIVLDAAHQKFTATFVKPVGIFAAGDTMPGHFDRVAGHLVTAVILQKAASKGA